MKKNYILSALVVIWLFLCSSVLSVNASVVSYTPQSYYFYNNFDETYFKNALSYLWDNPTFSARYSPDKTVIYLYTTDDYTVNLFASTNDFAFATGQYYESNVLLLDENFGYTHYTYNLGTESSLKYVDFDIYYNTVKGNTQFYYLPTIAIDGGDGQILMIGTYQEENGFFNLSVFPTAFKCSYVFNYSVVNPFNPLTDPLLIVPYNQGIQTQGFTEWLIKTEKYKTIPFELSKNKVQAFVGYFDQYGSSPLSFIKNFPAFALQISIQTPSDNILINTKTVVDNLYQEYLREKNDTVLAHQSEFRDAHLEIIPETSDDNKTLITSDPSDSVDTSILRDILRSLVALPNFIIDSTSAILNKLDAVITAIVNTASDDSIIFVSDAEINNYVDTQMNELVRSQAELSGIDSQIASSPFYLADTDRMQETDNVVLSFPSVSNIELSSDLSYSVTESTFEFDMSQYPTFDNAFKLFRKFSAVLLVFGFLVSLRYDLPNIIKAEGDGQ